MRLQYLIGLLLFLPLVMTSCDSPADPSKEADLSIYTSIYPIEYAAKQIGGEHTSVETVYPPGVDAHTYEPPAKRMTDIAESDAFFFLGAGMESFADNAASALKSSDVELVEIGRHKHLFANATNEKHEHAGHDHGDLDPHIWIDPVRMIDLSNIIKETLISIDPDHASDYASNFKALTNKLSDLDEKYQQTLANNPRKQIIVSHAAYGYWELRYGLEQIPISGMSASEEPSQKQLVSIIEQAQKQAIKYVIFEQNTSSSVSEIVQNYIGAKYLTLHNLSVLTKADIEQDRDYISIMQDNLKVLDTATSN